MMRIYLDEDCNEPLLAKLLPQTGHDVLTPVEAGMMQKSDPVQLGRAISDARVLITGNHDDFEDLHDLIVIAGGHHTGILVVRRDNDPTRDMTIRSIIRAVGKVAVAIPDLENVFQILNHWR